MTAAAITLCCKCRHNYNQRGRAARRMNALQRDSRLASAAAAKSEVDQLTRELAACWRCHPNGAPS